MNDETRKKQIEKEMKNEKEQKKDKEVSDDVDLIDLVTEKYTSNPIISRSLHFSTLDQKAQTYITEQTILVKLMYDFIARINKKQAEKLKETYLTHIEGICSTTRNQKTNVLLLGILQRNTTTGKVEGIQETKQGILKKITGLFGKQKRKEEED